MEKNKKIGLALSGGSALGFAHVGVLKCLAKNNIQIDFITGTSAGAIAGALYAFGVSPEHIEEEVANLKWNKLLQLKPSSRGLASNVAIREILIRHIGEDTNIEDSKIPLILLATNIENGELVLLKRGNLINAVLASSCLPGIFSPIEINGNLLIDGGIVENVPISPLKELGTDITIAVNLLKYRKYSKPKTILGVLMNSFDMINHRISAQPKPGDANILIEPDLRDYFMADFKKWKEILDIGYEETNKHILEIKENITRKNPIDNFVEGIKSIFNF
jgi:NTE family protein